MYNIAERQMERSVILKLELGNINIKDIKFADKSEIKDGIL